MSPEATSRKRIDVQSIVDSDSASSVSCSAEVVCLLDWLQISNSLRNGSFCHRSHAVDGQFLVFCYFSCFYFFAAETGVIVFVRFIISMITVISASIKFRAFSLFFFFSIADDIGLDSVMAFSSDDTLVWVSRGLVFWHVASHSSFEVRLGLSKHSTLVRFQDVTKSVHRCRFPNEPCLWISQGGETSWQMSQQVSWPEFRIIWLPKLPASG